MKLNSFKKNLLTKKTAGPGGLTCEFHQMFTEEIPKSCTGSFRN